MKAGGNALCAFALAAAILVTVPHVINGVTVLAKDQSNELDSNSGPSSSETAIGTTLSRIRKLQRTLAALKYAGKAEDRAAMQERLIGSSKLHQATSSASQAELLIERADSLLKSENALKAEQASSALLD